MSNLNATGQPRAAGYVRVSTDEQVREGWNLDADRQRIRDYAADQGFELVEIFSDGGRQGDDPSRPGLLALIAALDNVDVVVIRSTERLTRDPAILGFVTTHFRAAGVRLESFITGPIDYETPQGEFVQNLFASVGKFEKRLTGQRVKQAQAGRRRAGHALGPAPFGYRWQEGRLVVVPEQARVVERIFRDFAAEVSQRELTKRLNDERVPTAKGGRWSQSHLSRMLALPTYVGKVPGPDGELIDSQNEAIIDCDLWERTQARRTGQLKRRPGRHVQGGHLLVRGILKCAYCGGPMLARKAQGGTRERYFCKTRFEQGHDACPMPGIRRELVDERLLAELLERHIDLDATTRRIAERMESALAAAREVLAEAEQELAGAERRLAKVQRGWQDEVINDAEYAEQRAELIEERAGASEAVERAGDHVAQLERNAPVGDAEQVLLDHLAALKAAVSARAAGAPDLVTLRRVISDLFVAVDLVCNDDGSYLLLPALRVGRLEDGRWDYEDASRRRELPVPDTTLHPQTTSRRSAGHRRGPATDAGRSTKALSSSVRAISTR